MKWLLPLLLLSSCSLTVDEEAVREIVREETEVLTTAAEEPEEEPEPEPEPEAWAAEPRHIYLYPEAAEPDGTNYAKLYIAAPEDDYAWLLNAAKMKLESHNRDYPDDPWVIIGGGP